MPALSVVVVRRGAIAARSARARLVERGVLSWTAPLERMLPELASAMRPVYPTVTLRDLFAHQAGLQANIDTVALTAFRGDPRSLHEQRLAYARLALSQPPAYTPRAGNLYSNSGPVIAAAIAERATGLSYERGILVAANAGIDAGADVVEGRIVRALLPSLEAGRR